MALLSDSYVKPIFDRAPFDVENMRINGLCHVAVPLVLAETACNRGHRIRVTEVPANTDPRNPGVTSQLSSLVLAPATNISLFGFQVPRNI